MNRPQFREAFKDFLNLQIHLGSPREEVVGHVQEFVGDIIEDRVANGLGILKPAAKTIADKVRTGVGEETNELLDS